MKILPALGILIAALGALAWSCVYVVDEREQALLLAFGRVERTVADPGIYLKYPQPFNRVVYFDDRILPLSVGEQEVTPSDERRLVVTAFARYRITDPVLFFQRVTTQEAGEGRLEGILIDKLRGELGKVESGQILSPDRSELVGRIRGQVAEEAKSIGVEVIDVRIRSADLPRENLQVTYERMARGRRQIAEGIRANGQELARERRAQADREAVEIESAARVLAAQRIAEADAERAEIMALAYGADPEFFAFYESLQAAEETLVASDTSLILTPGGEFTGPFFEVISPTSSTSAPDQ